MSLRGDHVCCTVSSTLPSLMFCRSPASLDQIRGETICSQSQDDQQQISPLSNLTGDHSHSHATHSGYAQPTNTHQNFVSTTSTDGYFPVIYYHSQNIEMTIATLPGPSYVTTTSAGDDYLMDDGSAYYVCIDSGYGGPYYEKLGQVNQRYWVTGQSDMSSFSGTGNSGLKGCWVTATIQSDGGDFVGMQVCEKKCQDQVEAAGKAQLQGSETGVSVTSCIPF